MKLNETYLRSLRGFPKGILRLFLFGLLNLAGVCALYAQGPGGVNALLEVWLRADGGYCTTNGCVNTTWLSQVPAIYDASTDGAVALQTGQFNFNPVLNFDSNNDLVFLDPRPSANDFTIFVVFSTANNSNAGGGHWRGHPTILNNEINGPTNDFGLTLDDGQVCWYKESGAGNTEVTRSAGTVNSTTSIPHLASVIRSSTGPVLLRHNGNQTSGNGETGNLLPAGGTPAQQRVEFFGSANADNQGDLVGKLGEVIFFGSQLAGIELAKVETYLALKYGITKVGDYVNSSDSVIYSTSTHSNQIIGLIRDDNSILMQRQSVPAGFPNGFSMYHGATYSGTYPTTNQINTANDLPADQSLVVGHDNGSITFDTDFLGMPDSRIGRVFKITDVRGVGAVTLNFKQTTFTDLVGGLPYTLVFNRNDPTFATGNIFIPMIRNGATNDYRCEYNFPNNMTGYFTILEGSPFGPGGIGAGLEAWYAADTALATHIPATTWRDISGRGRHLTNTLPGSTTVTRGGVNFNHHIALLPLNRQFSTGSGVIARTMFMVSKLAGSGVVNQGVMGFQNNIGIPLAAGPNLSNLNLPAEFCGSTGQLRVNGNTRLNGDQPPFNNSWMVGSFYRAASNPLNNFHLGGFDGTNASPSNLNFGEVIIYSKDLSAVVPMNKVESYLAMKYGLSLTLGNHYYASNYNGTVGTTVYTSTGYSSSVTVIGRDDRSRLYQKQSKSVTQEATITLGLNGVIADSNAANSSVFANDLTFVAVGDNGGDDCWTNAELNMVTTVRQWLRVGREWKITKTGTIGSVLLRIENSPGSSFRVPPLPAGASNYVLLLSTDFDFSTGPAATVIPLTVNGPYLEASLSNLQLSTGGGTNYFTLGVQLPSSYQTLVPCIGDVVEFVGRDIANGGGLCIALGAPTTNTITLGVNMAADSFQIVRNNPTPGCLDTVRWTLPAGFSGGYFLHTSPTCNGATETRLINDSLRVGAPITPNVSIGLSDTAYLCIGDPNVTLNRTTNPGNGILSVYHYPGAMASPLLSIVDSVSLQQTASGDIYVHPGNLGHHVLTYRYPSGCSSTDSVHIYIGIPSPSTYSYVGSPLCTADTAVKLPTTLPSTTVTGGAFSSFPTGLSLNPTTGAVYANTSAPGAYLATYTPNDSTCGLPATFPLVVQVPSQTTFDYPTDICPGPTAIFPTVTSYAPGGTFSILPTTGVSIDATTGRLIVTSAAAGSYHVTYNAPGACSIDHVDSLFVLAQPVVTFPVLATSGEVCKMTPTVTASATPVGGTYSTFSPSSVLSLSGNVVNVTLSQVGGPYLITYIYTDPLTGCSDSVARPLTILPFDNPSVGYPRDGYCTNEPAQSPLFLPPTSMAGQFTSTPAGLTLNTNGTLTPGTSTAGIYTINFAYTHPACPTPVAVDVVEIAAALQAGFTVPDSVCFSNGSITLTPAPGAILDSLELFFNGSLMATSDLHVQGSNTVVFSNGGSVLYGDSTYTVVNYATNSLGCSQSASASFLIKADQNSDFAYLDSLYCANTSDPTPFIYGQGGGTFDCPNLNASQLDPTTGLLDLLASYTGLAGTDTFAITYTTAGPCATSTTDIVYLREGYDSYFQFPLNIVCSSINTVPTVDLVEDSVGISGFLQVGGPAVAFDPQLGTITNLSAINIPLGATDTLFFAHWTGSSNKCQDTTIQSLQVSKFDTQFGITYAPTDVVCGDRLIFPTLSGNISTAVVNNPVGVTYSSSGFAIVDGRFSRADTHSIVLIDRDVCGERDTAVLEILGLPDASFSYFAAGPCTDDSLFVPDTASIQVPGGVFSYTTADTFFDLNLNTTTGVVTLANSDPAQYTVYYTVSSANGCVNTDSQLVVISESPRLRVLEALPGPSVCVGDTIEFSGQGNGTISWFIDGQNTNQTGPIFLISTLQNGQVVKALLRNTAGCEDSLSIQVEILPPPTVAVVDRPSVITENDPFSIQLQPGQDNTIIAWRAEAIGLSLQDTSDTTAVLGSGDIFPITNELTLFSDYDPATIFYWFTAINNGCIGIEVPITIGVNPNGDRVFIPEVFTPDNEGDGNDVWQIRYDSDLIATDYRIEVYNRAGGLVHTVMNLDERWDGGGNPDGVYWWILRKIDGTVELQGGVTIRRVIK